MYDVELHQYEAVWMVKDITHVFRKLFDDMDAAKKHLESVHNKQFTDIRKVINYI